MANNEQSWGQFILRAFTGTLVGLTLPFAFYCGVVYEGKEIDRNSIKYEFAIRDTISKYKSEIQNIKANEPKIIMEQGKKIDSLQSIVNKEDAIKALFNLRLETFFKDYDPSGNLKQNWETNNPNPTLR